MDTCARAAGKAPLRGRATMVAAPPEILLAPSAHELRGALHLVAAVQEGGLRGRARRAAQLRLPHLRGLHGQPAEASARVPAQVATTASRSIQPSLHQGPQPSREPFPQLVRLPRHPIAQGGASRLTDAREC